MLQIKSDVLASYYIINSICLFFKGFSGVEGGALWWMSPKSKWEWGMGKYAWEREWNREGGRGARGRELVNKRESSAGAATASYCQAEEGIQETHAAQ